MMLYWLHIEQCECKTIYAPFYDINILPVFGFLGYEELFPGSTKITDKKKAIDYVKVTANCKAFCKNVMQLAIGYFCC